MKEEIHHKIEAYLQGRMSASELKTFEEELNTNAVLKEEVALYKAINLHVMDIDDDQEVFEDSPYKQELTKYISSDEGRTLDNRLLTIGQKYHDQTKPEKTFSIHKKGVIYFLMATAAMLAIVFGTSIFTEPSGADLYASYYTPEELPSFKTRSDETSVLKKATTYFNASKIKEASIAFNTYIEISKEPDPLVYIYTGLIQAEQGHLEQAIEQFTLLENADTIDTSKALWYKVLIYLKFEEKAKAKETLLLILQDTNNFKYKEAQKLLGEV